MYNKQNYDDAGVPYNDINWYDIEGQPFGIASNFNAIILNDANNIVDTKGAMAVGGNFSSSRGLGLGYGNDGNLTGTGYSPDMVRFLVGKNVAMQGPLVVIGHVVAGGNFRVARGSTYMIGKDGTTEQANDLSNLYQANGGSKYWSLSDRGTHYAVSSFDVPRYIPASRINADVDAFFTDAQDSLMRYRDCLTALEPNGTVTEHYHEWILQGNDPRQNVFLINAQTDGILNKEIRFEIPQGSLAIVILRTGDVARLKYGLWGEESLADHTLYVFEDAKDIYMDVPAAIWGSIFAPQATFHAHSTGGTVSGNAAFGSLTMNATTGFEFHLYPFVGGVICGSSAPVPTPFPLPIEVPEQAPTPVAPPEQPPTPPVEIPEQIPTPQFETPSPAPIPPTLEQPIPTPAPTPVVPPVQAPTPTPVAPPVQAPTPVIPPVQAPRPIPVIPRVPIPKPKPLPTPSPIVPIIPLVPIQAPVPLSPLPSPAPVCPTPAPCPECPSPAPCPQCPPCPECPKPSVQIQPIPIPIPLPCPEQEECEKCLIKPGVIFGCIWGCECDGNHEWEIKLYRNCGENKILLYCIKICICGCFEFNVPYDDYYLLEIRPVGVHHRRQRHSRNVISCKPMVTLKNVGVTNLMIE